MTPTAFGQVWIGNFEFYQPPGEPPRPLCFVAIERFSGRRIELWEDALRACREAPFHTGPDTVFCAFAAVAEIACFLALGWPPPRNVVCLFAEHRVTTNGLTLPFDGNGLADALAVRGLSHVSDETYREVMNKRATDPAPYSAAEQAEMLRHCAYNVEAAARLLDVMWPSIQWDRARFYGRFSAAVAAVERRGTPLAMPAVRCIVEHRETLLRQLIEAVDVNFQVYSGLVFKRDKFLAMTRQRGIDWPCLADGRTPSLEKETFEEMEFVHPEMHELRQLRATVSQLRDIKLAIGADGRNRCSLKPFMTKTGRCAPSTTEYVWGVAKWLRWLIEPVAGTALAYLDFAAEEFLIAAVLSGDERMLAAYLSGDPYVATGIALGLAPRGATAISHPAVRALCKVLLLGLSYGMTSYGLARRAGIALPIAEDVLRQHRQTFDRFWEWLDEWLASSRITRLAKTGLGWQMRVKGRIDHRSLQNWPVQSTAAEILRVLTIAAVEAGIPVCALIHDAVMIEAPRADIEDAVAAMRDCMVRAGQAVVGAALRVDVQTVPEGARFYDEKGEAMYRKVAALLPGVAS